MATPPVLRPAPTARWTAPAEVTAPPANPHAYEEWREADDLRAPYRLPHGLLRGIRDDNVEPLMECPLLCFVNARSGGQIGSDLALHLSRTIGRVQVFDISEHRPDKVLSKLYENIKAAEAAGDIQARVVRYKLRLLVCGGDGTIAWVMGVIKKLKLYPEPPVAIMPMGTGNDLSRSFKWGPAFTHSWIKGRKATYKTLNRVALAKEDWLDCWNVTITTPSKSLIKEHPHSLSPPPPAASATAAVAAAAAASRSTAPQVTSASGSQPIARGASSNLPGGAAAAAAAPSSSSGPGPGPGLPALHPAVVAARDGSVPGGGGERSIAPSVVATHGSATPMHNIASSSVGSAVTAFTTATNMSLHTAAAQAGTPVPTIVSGAVSNSAEEDGGIGVLGGQFWNYFSVGLDAKAAWGFHSLREARPGCTSSRAANQFWYSAFSCSSGWFCYAQPLRVKVKLEVLRPGPQGNTAGWQPVKLPRSVKAIVVLNLQSYAGGRNLWGPETSEESKRKKGLVDPSYNDGLLEVVGLKNGWHTAAVMASKGSLLHAKRLCQAAGVRLSLQAPYVRSDGEPSHCYMQIDGEPWRQQIPCTGSDGPVRVEIVHGGQSRVLRNDPIPKAKEGAPTPTRSIMPIVFATAEPGPLPTSASQPGPLPTAASQGSLPPPPQQQQQQQPSASSSHVQLAVPGGSGGLAKVNGGGQE